MVIITHEVMTMLYTYFTSTYMNSLLKVQLWCQQVLILITASLALTSKLETVCMSKFTSLPCIIISTMVLYYNVMTVYVHLENYDYDDHQD